MAVAQCQVTEYVFCCGYNSFGDLAHAPRGTPAETGLTTFKVSSSDGNFEKLNEMKNISNPAFLRYDPDTSYLYACTESILEDGLVVGYKVMEDAKLIQKSAQSANGTSTCYLTLDKNGEDGDNNLLFVNYWDSSLGSIPISNEGNLHPVRGFLKPAVVNSKDRSDHLKNRQLEPHAHAIVLDPYQNGQIAYVPDLGLDIIKQYRYCSSDGSFKYLSSVPSSNRKGPHGPRYIEFHPTLKIGYVVNELSSLITVFEYDEAEAQNLIANEHEHGETLRIKQEISTVPEGYTDYNTCGRVTVHSSGKYVLVSNRGHDSITVYSIDENNGFLALVGIHSTLGETPRHFQLNSTGEILVVANQDSDNLVSFRFDIGTGNMTATNNIAEVHSPNFVCFVKI